MVAGDRRLQPRASEKGGSATGPSPVDRARKGSKQHLLVDAAGIPLAWTVTGGNRNDVTQLVPLVERVPPVRGKVGRPRRPPQRPPPRAAPGPAPHAAGRRGRPPIAATTTTGTGASSVPAGSNRRSPVARAGTAPASDPPPWSVSRPSPTRITSD